MRQTFHTTFTPNPFDDPYLFIRILREKRAILFDLGYLGGIEHGNLLKITDIFVTHTHIDHFIAFDTILRLILRRDLPLRIFGPEGIIHCIEGKLNGYTWNLIKDYPLKIEAFEIKGLHIYHSSFYAENSFKRIDKAISSFNGTLYKDDHFTIKGLELYHQIPVLAYSLMEDFHININKQVLTEMQLPVGPWLSDFKRTVRRNYDLEKRALLSNDEVFLINDSSYTLSELMPIAVITKGQKISYIMDVSPTEENFSRIIPFIKHSDHLFCEAYFLEKDRHRAIERHHLTAADVGRIAKEAEVANLTIIHFSPKYINCPEELYNEAMREYKG